MFMVRRWVVRRAVFFSGLYRCCERVILGLNPLWRRVGLSRLDRPFALLERISKRFLFDCSMCGDCLLGSTGMSCPMNCPKRVRNGPCGGVRSDGSCELDQDMPCVWVDSWQGIHKTGLFGRYMTPRRAAETTRHGKSAWLQVIEHQTVAHPKPDRPEHLAEPLEEGPIRSSPYPPNPFEVLLNSEKFVVTAELSPPDSANPDDIATRASYFEGLVDAVNVPDGSGANCHMSSLASSLLLRELGFTPVMQFSCRDRNRIALQGDILGAAALGIKNLLCLTGDGVSAGDQPGARPVFDLDAVSLLRTAKTMRDNSHFMSGRPIKMPPDLFLGAALNPFRPPFDARPYRLAKKIAAGAQFFQTQYCYDTHRLETFLSQIEALRLHHRCHILVGVGPLISARSAHWVRKHVPGVYIPDRLILRMQEAKNEAKEGKRICIELIEQLQMMAGVSGVHVMVHKHERLLAEIIQDSGLKSA